MEVGTFYTIPTEKLGKQLEVFQSFYDLYEMRFCPNEEPNLLPSDKRVCRFCLKSKPQVTFNSKAHVFPHQLGNEHFISDFECDACNKKYAAFENDLSYFLGIAKTLFQTKGKNGIPNFHSPQDSITAKKVNLLNEVNAVSIKRKDITDESIIVDYKSGSATIEYNKNPYRPFNVYKILLKIGLSCINKVDVLSYKNVLEQLNDKTKVDLLKPLAKIFKTTLSYERNVSRPYAIIFKKKDPLLNVPTHGVSLYFNNMIFQYFIPLHKDDMQFYRTDMFMHYCPPLSPLEFNENDYHQQQALDLSSSELKKDDVEVLTMQTNIEEMGNFAKLDPNTGIISTVDANDLNDRIRQMVFVPKGYVITPDKLKRNNNRLLDS